MNPAEVVKKFLFFANSEETTKTRPTTLYDSAKVTAESIFLRGITGPKAFVVDEETTGIVALLLSHTQCVTRDVFFTVKIDDLITADERKRAQVKGMKAVCLLRPTNINYILLTKVLQDPYFTEYHLIFTGEVSLDHLSRIARCDVKQKVLKVKVLPLDFYAISDNFFSLEIPTLATLWKNDLSYIPPHEETIIERIKSGILSVVVNITSGVIGSIRFSRASPLARLIAEKIHCSLCANDIARAGSINLSRSNNRNKKVPTHILIVDRRDDPVTPLITPWTYQAMLSELMDFKLNRLKTTKDEVCMSIAQDPFFERTWNEDFGSLGNAVKAYMEEFRQKAEEKKAKVIGKELQDAQEFIEAYPEYRQLSENVQKHVDIVHSLSSIINRRKLMSVSEVEQSIVGSRVQQKEVAEGFIRRGDIMVEDKIRIALLYALRYESDLIQVSDMKKLLSNYSADHSELIDAILNWAGDSARSCQLTGWGTSFFERAKDLVRLSRTNPQQNILTQHTSLVSTLVKNVIEGNLDPLAYPSLGSYGEVMPGDCICFIIGGATMKEVYEVSCSNANGGSIYLGGSCVLNSRSFLTELKLFSSLDEEQRTLSNRPTQQKELLPRQEESRPPIIIDSSDPARAADLNEKKRFLDDAW